MNEPLRSTTDFIKKAPTKGLLASDLTAQHQYGASLRLLLVKMFISGVKGKDDAPEPSSLLNFWGIVFQLQSFWSRPFMAGRTPLKNFCFFHTPYSPLIIFKTLRTQWLLKGSVCRKCGLDEFTWLDWRCFFFYSRRAEAMGNDVRENAMIQPRGFTNPTHESCRARAKCLPSVHQSGRHHQHHASHMTKGTPYARTWLVERKIQKQQRRCKHGNMDKKHKSRS